MKKSHWGTCVCRFCGKRTSLWQGRKSHANDSQSACKKCLLKQQLRDQRGRKPNTR